MAPKPTKIEQHKADFATDRSHKASEIAYDLCKVTAQACLLINGGAATAIIAFMGKGNIDPHLLAAVRWSLGGYAAGVFASAAMMFCTMMNADYWNYYWYTISYEGDEEGATNYETVADRWHFGIYFFFVASVVFFLASSVVLSFALFQPAS